MKNTYLIAVGSILVASLSFVACSGDDDVTPSDPPGQDASTTTDSSVPPRDSGTDAAEEACMTCGESVQGFSRPPCESAILYIQDVNVCMCSPNTCGSQCAAPCAGSAPPPECIECLQTGPCSDVFGACLADNGTYIPRDGGATDGGNDSDAGDAAAGDASTDGGDAAVP